MITHPNRRTLVVAWAALGFIVGAAPAAAQVRILPRTSQPAARENYVLQIANDHQVAITRIEIRFPRSVKVLSLGERTDWPVLAVNSGKRVSSAVWTGTLSPSRFTEFGFIAVNPSYSVSLVWPVIVTFADGERALWWTGASPTKAPVTVVGAPARDRGNLVLALSVCLIALLLALFGLIVALRSGSHHQGGFQPGAN